MTKHILHLDEDADGTYERRYKIPIVENKNDPKQLEGVNANVPGQKPSNSRVISVQGPTEEITLECIMINDGTDWSETTADETTTAGEFDSDTVVTLQEQKRWLKEFITVETVGAKWRITGPGYDSGTFNASDNLTDGGKPVFINDIDPNERGSRPNEVFVRISLLVGDVVSI